MWPFGLHQRSPFPFSSWHHVRSCPHFVDVFVLIKSFMLSFRCNASLIVSPKSANSFIVSIPTAFLNKTGLSSSITCGFPSLKIKALIFMTDDLLLVPLSQLPPLLLHVDICPALGLLHHLQTRLPCLLLLQQRPSSLHSVESGLGSLEIAWNFVMPLNEIIQIRKMYSTLIFIRMHQY